MLTHGHFKCPWNGNVFGISVPLAFHGRPQISKSAIFEVFVEWCRFFYLTNSKPKQNPYGLENNKNAHFWIALGSVNKCNWMLYSFMSYGLAFKCHLSLKPKTFTCEIIQPYIADDIMLNCLESWRCIVHFYTRYYADRQVTNGT